MKRKFIIICLLVASIFSLTNCNNCKLCDGEKINLAKYDTLYPIPEGEFRCDYIILRKKQDEDSTKKRVRNFVAAKNKDLSFQPIKIGDAIDFVQNYNEKYNADLMYTSFIDMDRQELMLFLIEVSAFLRGTPEDKSNTIRIYLADRSKDINNPEISSIITVKSDDGEVYLKKPALEPLDWGSLCPPPSSCIGANKANLLQKAIEQSNDPSNTPANGRRIKKP